jgi:PAS domain S-box-containing protein
MSARTETSPPGTASAPPDAAGAGGRPPLEWEGSRELLEALIETTPSLVVLADGAGRIALFNRACEELTGYSREEVMGRTIGELFLPAEWRNVVARRFADLDAPEVRTPHENPWRTKAGSVRWIEWRCSPIRLPGQPGVWVMGTGHDVTERRRLETEVQRETAQLRLLERITALANQSDSVADTLRTVLAEICAFTGWSAGHVWHIPPARPGSLKSSGFWFPEENTAFAAFRQATAQLELRLGEGVVGRVAQTGRPLWIEDIASDLVFLRSRAAAEAGLGFGAAFPILAGARVRGVMEFYGQQPVPSEPALLNAMQQVGIHLGRVFEREEARRQLEQSEERLRLVLENAIDAVVTTDAAGRITSWNAKAERTFGWKRAEVLGRLFAEVILPEADRARHLAGWEHYQATGEHPVLNRRVEIVALQRDGTEFPAEMALTPIRHGNTLSLCAFLRDITKRKSSEEALRASEARFRQLVELLPSAIYVCNASGLILEFNDHAASLWGRAPGIGERQNRFCGSLRLRHPDGSILPHEESPVARTLKTGKSVRNAEYFIERADGSRVAVLANTTPITNPEGTVMGAINCLLDITDRKTVEEHNNQTRELLERVLDANPTTIFAKDRESRIVMANRTMARFYGLRVADTIGRTQQDLHESVRGRPEDLERWRQDDEEVISTGLPVYRIESTRAADGSERMFNTRKFPLPLPDGQTGVLVVSEDITERLKAESGLRASEERFRGLFEVSPDVIYVLSAREVTFLSLSPAFEAMTGWSCDDWIGRPVRELLHPEDVEAAAERFHAVLHGEPPRLLAVRYRTKHGGYRIAEVVTRTMERDGEVVALCGFGRDITDRRRYEEAIRTVAQAVSGHGGSEYLRTMVRALCEGLAGDIAFIGELPAGDAGRVRTLAVWSDGKLAPNFDYDLADTPCDKVVGGRLCVYPSGVQRRFPEDAWLRECGIESYVGMPLFDSRRRPLGLIAVVSRAPLTDARLAQSMLQILATRAAGEIERSQADEAIRRLAARLLKAQDEERRRISRELHDSTAQTLAALEMNLDFLHHSADRLDPKARESLATSLELAHQCSAEIRTLSFLLHPPMLEELGLASALHWYAEGLKKRSRLDVHLTLPEDLGRLPADVELLLFRVVQEALTNVLRHSGSRKAFVKLTLDADRAILKVEDRGRGFAQPQSARNAEQLEEIAPQERLQGVGLASMSERLREHGGSLVIRSGKRGATVVAIVPLRSSA